ncbi:hypothetical protein GCM10009839_85670 [Catenulispora yoronensis]|uniref:Right handed beta helix domain-containing protein n=1 Tax=Catenulispora yoronensis TaxID=450799 RepID=A0ABP5H6V6_9ACTN
MVGGPANAQWITPSNDPTGVLDTPVIQAGLTSGSGVWLAPGDFYINTTLTFAANNTVLYGQGRRASRIHVAPGFTGAHAVDLGGHQFCEVRDLSIEAPAGTLGTSTQLNGIHLGGGGIRNRIAGVYFLNLNGWGFTFDSTTANCAGLVLEDLVADTCAGAISLRGPASPAYHGSAAIIAPSAVNMGTGSGPLAGAPAFAFTDFEDVTFFAHPATTPRNGGGAIVITGDCAALFFYGADMGGTPNSPAVVIQDDGTASPTAISFHGGFLQLASIGAQIIGSASKILFEGVHFQHNQTHGLSIENAGPVTATGHDVLVSRCFFAANGNGATGTDYDLNWAGGSTGDVLGCHFGSTIVNPVIPPQAPGVRFSVNNATANVRYELNTFPATSDNYTADPPSHVLPTP